MPPSAFRRILAAGRAGLLASGLAIGLGAGAASAQLAAPFNPGEPITPPGLTGADAAAYAAEPFSPATAGVRFTIGAGAAISPDYFGSDEYSIGPAGIARFDYIRLPGGFEFGSAGSVGFLEGFGPRGAARYIGSRKASDNSELRGLDDVDASLELGLGFGYDAEFWRAYADARYGVIGHHSWVGELGADAILRPNDAWVVNFGPRAQWGSDRFMQNYFGVSDREAERTRTNFDEPYDASSGFYSVGVELGARYAFSPNWGVEGKATYERLINDAADSPIVEQGTANQYGVQVLITRSLSLGF